MYEYTLAGIRQEVLVDKLDDVEYDSGVVDRAINAAQREILNKYELSFQEGIFSGTIPQGSTIFKLPADVAYTQSQIIAGENPYDLGPLEIPFRDFNNTFPVPEANTPGKIACWASYAGKMLTSCPTDKDYIMNLFYIKKATPLLSGTDIPMIPEEFRELLVLGAYWRIQKREGDLEEAVNTKLEYNELLTDLVSRYGQRNINGPLTVANAFSPTKRR